MWQADSDGLTRFLLRTSSAGWKPALQFNVKGFVEQAIAGRLVGFSGCLPREIAAQLPESLDHRCYGIGHGHHLLLAVAAQ